MQALFGSGCCSRSLRRCGMLMPCFRVPAQKVTTSAFRLHRDPADLVLSFLSPAFCCFKLIFSTRPKNIFGTGFSFGISCLCCRENFYLQALCACGRLQDISSLSCWSWFRPTPHSQQFIFNLLSRSSASEPLQSMRLLLLPILGSWVCVDASSM